MATPKIIPRANGEGGLGMDGKGWGSVYIADVRTGTANTGAILQLSSDDGAPMGDSHRLGVIDFKGAEDSSGTLVTGARIEALTDAAWTNVENGCALYFYTTDADASQTNVLKLDSNQKATFSGEVRVNGSSGVTIHNSAASSTTGGGSLILANDDGAVMADNHQLGAIEFKGAEDGSGTLSLGSSISSVCRDAWDASNNDADLVFSVVNGTTLQKALVLDADTHATFLGNVKAGGNVTGVNYRTIWVDAGSMVPTVTNGAAAGTEELATNDVMVDYFAFDTSTDEKVQFKIVMPEQWDGGTIKAKFYWKSSNTDTGDVAWFIQAVAHADSGALDTAFGTAVSVASADDVGLGTDNDLHITGATAAMTVAGSPAEGEMVMFQIYRDVSADNYNADAHLLGVNLQYRESVTASAAW
tara:strand:+ start:945 stop:2189 length:1245 start_codon:yes stop_codon:yes gene_type:complete